MARKLSKKELEQGYRVATRDTAVLRAALTDMVNGAITWQPEQVNTSDKTRHRYGWGRLDSASGGYLIYSFGAPNQPNLVRVEYLDDAVIPRNSTIPDHRFRADAIMAAKVARDRLCATHSS